MGMTGSVLIGSFMLLLEKGRNLYPTWNVDTDNYVGMVTTR